MMNKGNWRQISILTIVLLLVLFLVSRTMGGFGGYGYGMHRMMGAGMMGSWGLPIFGGLGMFLMGLIPLGFLALLVAGIVGLVRMSGGSPAPIPHSPRTSGTCPSCGQPTQADWQLCPYCGQVLT